MVYYNVMEYYLGIDVGSTASKCVVIDASGEIVARGLHPTGAGTVGPRACVDEALADAWCALEGDSLLYDPEKAHVKKVVDLARESGAAGVILLLAKFCDPEEFDAPLVKAACREAGIPFLQIEIDQSTETYEQARTQLEAFGGLL